MTWFRQYISIVSLFVLLLAVAALPAVFIAYQSGRSLGEVVRYPVEVAELGPGVGDLAATEGSAGSYDVWTRLELIGLATQVIHSDMFVPLRRGDELLMTMEEQLGIMQELHALHGLPLSEMVSAAYTRRIYMDASAPERAVSVWEIGAEYKGGSMTVLMDTELCAIYQISVTAHPGYLLEYNSDPLELYEGFFRYLDLFSDGGDAGGAVLTIDWDGESSVYLSAIYDLRAAYGYDGTVGGSKVS